MFKFASVVIMHVTYKLCSLLKSLLGLTVAKRPLLHVVQLASGVRGEVSVEVFQGK